MIVEAPKKRRPEPTPEEKARSRRSIAMAVGLVAFVILVFTISILRMSNGGPQQHF